MGRPFILMLATAALLVVVLIYGLAKTSPQIYFDIDPRLAMTADAEHPDIPPPVLAMGPATGAILDLVTVLLSAAALAMHILNGGRLHWLSSLLVLLGCAACIHHMPDHVDNLKRTGHWIAAACSALAALHLAQHDQPRRLIIAACVAMIVPMTLAAMWYVFRDHPQTVADYILNKAKYLQSRGWQPGSPHHLIYERRLMSPEAIGPFGLSNVFASIIAGFTLLAVALTLGLIELRAWVRSILPGAVALLGFVCMYLSGSKGGAVALTIGLTLVLILWAARRRKLCLNSRVIAMAGLACVALAVAVVLVRGAMGPPPSAAGERSLLFRSQYWHSTANMLGDMPATQWSAGMGPSEFRNRYLVYKQPLNPEQVISTHNVVLDYIAMLGFGGAAWCLALLAWMWRGANFLEGPDDGNELDRKHYHAPVEVRPTDLLWALAVTVGCFAGQFALEIEGLLLFERLLVWTIGAGLMLTVLAVLLGPGWMRPWWTQLGVFAAAVTLMVHSQIEMTFFHQGAVNMAWLIMAVCAGGGSKLLHQQGTRLFRVASLVVPVVMIGGASIFLLPRAVGLARQQKAFVTAAVTLQQGDIDKTIGHLQTAVAAIPIDPWPYRWQLDLHHELAQRSWTTGDLQAAGNHLGKALAILDRLPDAVAHDLSMIRRHIQIQDRTGRLSQQPWRSDLAANLAGQLIHRNPYSVQDHLLAGDLHWRLGRTQEAGRFYHQALQLSDMAYLDPLHQLSDTERRDIEDRLSTMR